MSQRSAIDNGVIGIQEDPGPVSPRVRRRAGRRPCRRRLCVVAGLTVASLLLWLKISLGFGHGSTVARAGR
jgi:hypothetical protein